MFLEPSDLGQRSATKKLRHPLALFGPETVRRTVAFIRTSRRAQHAALLHDRIVESLTDLEQSHFLCLPQQPRRPGAGAHGRRAGRRQPALAGGRRAAALPRQRVDDLGQICRRNPRRLGDVPHELSAELLLIAAQVPKGGDRVSNRLAQHV